MSEWFSKSISGTASAPSCVPVGRDIPHIVKIGNRMDSSDGDALGVLNGPLVNGVYTRQMGYVVCKLTVASP